jgi:ubiquinone/menaquinone biosynthesis C-methylase UbiE
MTLQKDPEGFEQKNLHKYADFTDKRVLEVGCGEGRLTWKYAASARQVAGIDLEANNLRVARIDRSSDLDNKVSFTQASARNIPFHHETFDIAILAWSL